MNHNHKYSPYNQLNDICVIPKTLYIDGNIVDIYFNRNYRRVIVIKKKIILESIKAKNDGVQLTFMVNQSCMLSAIMLCFGVILKRNSGFPSVCYISDDLS